MTKSIKKKIKELEKLLLSVGDKTIRDDILKKIKELRGYNREFHID